MKIKNMSQVQKDKLLFFDCDNLSCPTCFLNADKEAYKKGNITCVGIMPYEFPEFNVDLRKLRGSK